MSDTPRTDGEETFTTYPSSTSNSATKWVRKDFARQLERELAAANAALETMRESRDDNRDAKIERGDMIVELREELAAKNAECEELRRVIDKFASGTRPDEIDREFSNILLEDELSERAEQRLRECMAHADAMEAFWRDSNTTPIAVIDYRVWRKDHE